MTGPTPWAREGVEDPPDTPFDAIGGAARVRALVDAFYDHMDGDAEFAVIRALHVGDLGTVRDKFHKFLTGWLGGPPLYVEEFGHPRLRGRHMPFPIGERERDQWLACMGRALDDTGVEGELRSFLDARFAHVANFMMNR
jgi:hemoglobin